MGRYNMTERIQYIDRLKGISMLMVVVGHLILFCEIGNDNQFSRHINLINMPLFFFLNVLVIRNIHNWGGIY